MNPVTPQQIEAVKAVLAGMTSPDPAARQTAVRTLRTLDTWAVPLLADAVSAPDPATAKAAKAAMEGLTHHLLTPSPDKNKPDAARQTRLADTLADVAESSRPRAARACAVSLLGFAGAKRQEKRLERLENDRDIGADVGMARARIKSAGY